MASGLCNSRKGLYIGIHRRLWGLGSFTAVIQPFPMGLIIGPLRGIGYPRQV